MPRYFLFLFLLLCASCICCDQTEQKTQALVQAGVNKIDWDDVDSYPLFEVCDENDSKVMQKRCFGQHLVAHLSNSLKELNIKSATNQKSDTLYFDLLFKRTGIIVLVGIHNQKALGKNTPIVKAAITKSLRNLPHIEPALKKGIPVSAKFRIPIILGDSETLK